jgi:hypothetical protein
MSEKKGVLEECLYCHGQLKPGTLCHACGDTMLAESLRPNPSPRPTLMFPPGPMFEPKIAGV